MHIISTRAVSPEFNQKLHGHLDMHLASYLLLDKQSNRPLLQIPLWWVHPAVHPDLEPLKGTEHVDHRGGISLYNIIQAQLLADATSIWVPKYLLILYQMTM